MQTRIKTPLRKTAEVVIGGWIACAGRCSGSLGALLLGVPGSEGDLQYVGTGFTDAALVALAKRLADVEASTNPFGTSVRQEFVR